MTVDLLIEQKMFFGKETGWGFEIMMILALYLIGFAFSGLTRSTLIKPRDIIWPGILSTTALTGVLHRHGGLQNARFVTSISPTIAIVPNWFLDSSSSWKVSGFTFFSVVFFASFCWYWLPGFLFPALSYFSFPCWINPSNRLVNQLFGVSSGMGLLPLTLDCECF